MITIFNKDLAITDSWVRNFIDFESVNESMATFQSEASMRNKGLNEIESRTRVIHSTFIFLFFVPFPSLLS